ncbi:MAG: hypothetical protein B6D61_14545 [Bacteroidetes bacterium 4484_249]|nr:MAG: hypothetical protein B6D61_14545 [Bacteroidetes bacterium 4484_249]
MKKSILFIVFVLSVVYINAQNWMEFTASETISPDYNILQSNDTIVQFTVTIPGMYETPIDTFNRVNIKEHIRLDSVGYPEIPIVSFLVAIPDCDSVNLIINPLDSSQFTGFNIYPAPELVQDTTPEGYVYLREEFIYDQTAYSNDNWFPGILGNETGHGAIRSQSVIRILIYPVQFNPVKKIIKAYSEYNISLTFNNATGTINNDVGIFNEMLGNSLINYESNGLNASVNCGMEATTLNCEDYFVTSLPNQNVDDPCDYLIITPTEFFENTWLCDLADHRTSYNGFDVKIVTIDIIISQMPQQLDLNQKIKLLISNTYFSENANNTYDGKLAYVNLVGDVFMESTFEGIPTFSDGYDVIYTQLTIPPDQNEPDIYPDLMIGRCSVDNEKQLQNVVTKITGFTPYSEPYNDKVLNFLGHEGNEYYDNQSEVLEELDYLLSNTYENELIYPTNYYGYLPSDWDPITYTNCQDVDVVPSYSNGQIFFNYMGHGNGVSTNMCGFSYDDIDDTPEDQLTFGKFHTIDDEDCFGEQFLCYDHNKGAIGFIGASENVVGNSFYILSNYYESLLNNYSLMLGEALMETKLQYTYNNNYYINSYNLLGDPALNIFYENSAPLPDLSIKYNHISFTPFPTNHGETIIINARIRNNTGIPVDHPFTVNCYAINTESLEIIQIDDKIVQSVPDNYVDVPFYWNTTGFELNENDFDVFIDIDTGHEITEIIETNNSNSNNLKLYLYAPEFPVEVEKADNANPVCFDFYQEYDGDEIIFGENIFSLDGSGIYTSVNGTAGYTSVGDLYNNDKFQYVTIKSDPLPVKIKAFEPPSTQPVWQNQLSQNCINRVGPVISDLDHDGFEEVIVLEVLPDVTKLICLDHTGEIRWNYEFLFIDVNEYFLVCNLNNPFNHIVVIDKDGKIYFYKENENNNGLVEDYNFEIPNCGNLDKKFTASDLDKDGYIDLAVIFKDDGVPSETKLGVLNTLNMSFLDVVVPCSGNVGDPIAADLTNDGLLEIVIPNFVSENIYIYDNSLNPPTTITIDGLALSEIVSGDFNNDGSNDLVVLTQKSETDYFINIYDQSGLSLFKIPILDKSSSPLISDVDHDNKNEIVYSYGRNLYIVDIPDAGQGIGWPGHRGNIRSTGVYEQPSYLPGIGETVYWTNTISLSGDNIIPFGSTVIIKSGTKIKAHTGSSLVVHGTLIAEGTKNHPITFSADINGADNDYWQGITVTNFSSASFAYCQVSDAEMGILVEDENNINISYCHFENNMVGIGAFNSSPVIYENFITNNNTGIHSWKNATPVLTDFDKYNPFRNGIIDNQIGIKIYEANIYLKYGFNDIYNISGENYYIYLNNSSGGVKSINAVFNYWGTTNLNEIYEHLYPAENIIIEPICLEAQSPYTSSGDEESEMLKTAYNSMENEEYQDAENTFKEIISQYPATDEAYLSVSGLYENTNKANGNWNDLETYLSGLHNDSTFSIDFHKLAYGYLNLCKRKQNKFTEAIANYESVILNDPTYNDSVYAVIDIGNTYEEAGNYKSTLGQLSYLIPASRARHVEKTVDLLLSLKTEEIKPIIEKGGFDLGQNYPNPFDNTTTINYYVPNQCKISFEILDILGREVLNLNQGTIQKGEQKITVDLSNFAPGVYYYVLKADAKVAGVRKMVVK